MHFPEVISKEDSVHLVYRWSVHGQRLTIFLHFTNQVFFLLFFLVSKTFWWVNCKVFWPQIPGMGKLHLVEIIWLFLLVVFMKRERKNILIHKETTKWMHRSNLWFTATLPVSCEIDSGMASLFSFLWLERNEAGALCPGSQTCGKTTWFSQVSQKLNLGPQN